jgi:alpha-mannosidase
VKAAPRSDDLHGEVLTPKRSANVGSTSRMIHHTGYTRARLAQTAERMRALVYPETWRPHLSVSDPVGYLSPEEAATLEYRPAELGMQLGPPWTTFWFRLSSAVPASCDGHRVDLLWQTGSESTLWRDDHPIQGLNTSGECPRPDALLVERGTANQPLEFMIETVCSGAFGQHDPAPAGLMLRRCELARFDPEAWKLWLDFSTLQQLESELNSQACDPAWAGHLLDQLNRICNYWDPDKPSTWQQAAAALADLYRCRNGSVAHEIVAVGHAHIDTAWLWPLSETYRKCVRTFATQANLIDRYPNYRFACSQAQQYAWIKEHQPDLYERITDRVGRGQWLPVGGTWIEPDCNIPSGEALVRQFLFGQRFFEAEFGSRCSDGWLPDTFGYNGQLPQVLRGSGLNRFLTQKLADNRFTKQPHHTFVWQGIDGSEVVTHFPPADTYTAEATVDELCLSARNFKDHVRSRISLLPFGYGDGGGGPTAQMIETLERVNDLQSVPRTYIDTPTNFFERLEAQAAELPRIVGELYYEYHQGTYTSQAQTKRANRRCEQLLHDTEFLCTLVERLELAAYPTEQLASAWQLQLTNAFHDILPGSSITQVYEDAARDYAKVAQACEELCTSALDRLSSETGEPKPLNTTSFERTEVTEDPSGNLVLARCPPYGIGAAAHPKDEVRLTENGEIVLANAQLQVSLTPGGDLTSMIHKDTGYDCLAEPGNRLELYDDRPVAEEAWNVDPFHLETGRTCPRADRCEIVNRGPLRAEVVFDRSIGKQSRLRQAVRLDAHSPRVEFHTTVDWQEDHTFLKVAFPTVLHAPQATYEMQFGAIERPTHASTLQDLARYEVPGHRFIDLAEPGFGLSILTDCKYGYSVHAGTMRISLLRAPREPDSTADIGTHTFAYALLPHAGRWQDSPVVAEAASFNAPLRWTRGEAKPFSFAQVESGLVLDTIKRAEDGNGFIVRLYEPYGKHGSTRLTIRLPAELAGPCNLLEDPIREPVPLRDGSINLSHRPFEILTLRIT